MAIKIMSSTFNGIEGVLVTVEVDIARGLPCFNIVGLADTSVKESKERVRSAIVNSGFQFPLGRITINLAPADIRKEGALFDLPIALGILAATGQIELSNILDYLIVGELSLSGEINKIKGALPIVIVGSKKYKKFIIPNENANECSIVDYIDIYPFNTLNQVIDYFEYKDMLPFKRNDLPTIETSKLNFSEVKGQDSCKRALEISSAGNHNTLLIGPPGCGKSMLVKRIPSILPSLTYQESLELTKIYSIAGLLDSTTGLMTVRPFRTPHHTATKLSLSGGGNKLLPGEVSLSHHGVLFLDELLEFKRSVLEVLREPLEEKYITISRSSGTVKYPANFMLVGALNPCPCGFYLSKYKECTCSEHQRKKYINQLSGPFLDRMDIISFAYPNTYEEISSEKEEESSELIKERVEAAREIQRKRFKNDGIFSNGEMNDKLIKEYCKLDLSSQQTLEKFFIKYPFSARGYTRILKVARTIADLSGAGKIKTPHIIEAIKYRQLIDDEVI